MVESGTEVDSELKGRNTNYTNCTNDHERFRVDSCNSCNSCSRPFALPTRLIGLTLSAQQHGHSITSEAGGCHVELAIPIDVSDCEVV